MKVKLFSSNNSFYSRVNPNECLGVNPRVRLKPDQSVKAVAAVQHLRHIYKNLIRINFCQYLIARHTRLSIMGLSGGFLLNRYRLPSEIPYAANKNLTKEIPMAEQDRKSVNTVTPQIARYVRIA